MRAYKVRLNAGGQVATRYGSTQANAREVRDTIVTEFDVKKSQVSIEEVEIPTAKAELLEFINELSKVGDVKDVN